MLYKYSYKYPQRELAALNVCNTGVQRCEPGYSWGPGVRDHYLIHYVISGSGVYETNGVRHELRAGDLFLSQPDMRIFYQASEDDPWEYCWVGFHGTDAEQLIERIDLDAPVHVNLRLIAKALRRRAGLPAADADLFRARELVPRIGDNDRTFVPAAGAFDARSSGAGGARTGRQRAPRVRVH